MGCQKRRDYLAGGFVGSVQFLPHQFTISDADAEWETGGMPMEYKNRKGFEQ